MTTVDGGESLRSDVSGRASGGRGHRARFAVAAAAILVLVFACRLLASFDEFWFDEILSWVFASEATSQWQILTEIRHDSNHFLNTWLIYVLGVERHWIVYRAPAVLAGVGTVFVAGRLARRRSDVEALTAMILTGGSFLLIQYSSEARGYAYVLFFSVLSWLLAQDSLENSRRRTAAWLGAAAILGFLSHLTYLFCYLGILAWSLAFLLSRGRPRLELLAVLSISHTPPMLFMAWLYDVNLRHMVVGGGARQALSVVAARATSLAVGGPESGRGVVVAAIAAAIAFAVGLWLIGRRERDSWIFYFTAVVAAPVLTILVRRPEVLYTRYFLVCVLFLQLVLSHVLARIYVRSSWGKPAFVVLVAAILCGNTVHTARLLRVGRGGYAAALMFMQRETKGPTLTIGSDHDLRNPLSLSYHWRHLADAKRPDYFSRDQWPPKGPEWVLYHSQERSFHPDLEIQDPLGNRYQLVMLYPYAGLSGWHLAVYHNENPR